MRDLLTKLWCIIICGLFILNSLSVSAQSTKQKAEYLLSFAKVAGAIQYFSPTDAVHQTRWDKVYINGVRAVSNIKNEHELADTLVRFFKPLEPSLLLVYKKDTLSSAKTTNNQGQLVISKQNKGLDLLSGSYRTFKSTRLNRRSLISDIDMYEVPLIANSILLTNSSKNAVVHYKYKYQVETPLKVEISRDKKMLFNSILTPSDSLFSFTDTVNLKHFNLQHNLMLDENLKLSLASYELILDNTILKQTDLDPKVDSLQSISYEIKIFGNDAPLYKQNYQIGDSLLLSLKGDIKVQFPLAVYGDEENTFPIADAISGNYIYKYSKFGKYNQTSDLDEPTVRIANILHLWNVFRLAFVYNPFNSREDDQLLIETLERAFLDKTVDDYYRTIWNMLSKYEDSHIFLHMKGLSQKFSHTPPITLIPIKDRMFVKLVHEPAIEGNINQGDELISINGTSVKDAIKYQLEKTSGSLQNRMVHVGFELLEGPEGSLISLNVKNTAGERKTVKMMRNYQEKNKFLGASYTRFKKASYLTPHVYYFDMTRDTFTDSLKMLMNNPNMNIIIDLRGYISDVVTETGIISNMINEKVVKTNIYAYHIMAPDRKEFVADTITYMPESTNPKAKLYFLADASTQSAPESLLDIVKYYKVGKIIGQPTAGANGNINMLELPGGMAISFSGLLVKNSDGSKHHLRGIIPDYYASYNVKDIILENDPFIEKALKVIQKDSKK